MTKFCPRERHGTTKPKSSRPSAALYVGLSNLSTWVSKLPWCRPLETPARAKQTRADAWVSSRLLVIAANLNKPPRLPDVVAVAIVVIEPVEPEVRSSVVMVEPVMITEVIET